MSFAIKVDARLKALEKRAEEMVQAAAYVETIRELLKRIEALEAKRGPGRPPKNG